MNVYIFEFYVIKMGPYDVYFLHVLFKKFLHMCVCVCVYIKFCLTFNSCVMPHVLTVSLRTTQARFNSRVSCFRMWLWALRRPVFLH